MSAKECGHHHNHRKKILHYVWVVIIAIVVLFIVVAFLAWLILRPAKPQFTLQEATVKEFNISSDHQLTTTLQVTLSSRNPNARMGIYYDRLDIYVSYHSQQITLRTSLPRVYQGHKDITVWSSLVYAVAEPMGSYLAEALYQDEISGSLFVNIRVDGRIRWKVGSLVIRSDHLYVNCPASISCGKGDNGGAGGLYGAGVNYDEISMDCNVDV